MIYFSFKTFAQSGIGDQIGAQFSHCYSLGHQCGWTYVHLEPFQFDRRTPGCQRQKGLSSIAEYLGLSFADQRPYVSLEVTILFSTLIRDASSIQHVRNNLNLLVNRSVGASDADAGINGSLLLHIELDENYHALIPSIQRLTGMNWEETLRFSGENYLQHKRASGACRFNSPRFAVAHIRIGDCVRIDTQYCPVILHGDKVYTSLGRYQDELGLIDPSRVSKIAFKPFDFLETVRRLMQASCIQSEQLYIVSDGFKASKRCVLSHVFRRKLRLDIGILALLKLNELECMFANAIKWVPRSQRIIGEEPHNTLLSIELFSKTSLLMCNTGGFSNAIYNVYNPGCAAGGAFEWL